MYKSPALHMYSRYLTPVDMLCLLACSIKILALVQGYDDDVAGRTFAIYAHMR